MNITEIWMLTKIIFVYISGLVIASPYFWLNQSAIDQIDLVKIVNFKKMLHIPDGLRTHTMAYEMYLACGRPSTWHAIRKSKCQFLMTTFNNLSQ